MKFLKAIALMILLSLQPFQSVQATGNMSMQMKVVKISDTHRIKEVQVQLTHLKNGTPVTLDDLKEVHTQKIHFLIIDDSLEDYSHVHSTALNISGLYAFEWSPKLKNANYKIWADVTSQKTGTQEYVLAELTQLGKPTDAKINKTTVLDSSVGGYNFSLQFDNKELQVGKMIMGRITVTNKSGKPVTNLEPIMGAFGHIVGFYDDDKTIVHIHPLSTEPTKASDRSGPELDFHMEPSRAGFVKLFAQVKIKGKEIYVPFGFTIK